jgi:hypothetical protein
MLTRVGETLLLQGEARYWGADGPAFGTLYLTNRRIVFERDVGRTTQTFLDCGLDEIVQVGVNKPPLGKLALYVVLRAWKGQFRVADPKRWLEEVTRLKRQTDEKQVVLVRCGRCGALNDELDPQCFDCHSPL